MLAGVPGASWGQGPPPDAAALQEVSRLNSEVEKLYREGKFDTAFPLAERALAIREKALGPDHPEVAASLDDIAVLYHARGEYTRAEPLLQRALAIRERALGPDHPAVAESLNNLAGLYQARGDYARPEPLYQRALAIREKALGEAHPDVVTSLNNLALLYDAKGDYARAEPLYQRALAIGEKALRPDHPDVAASLNNLAALYNARGDYARAEPLYQRALAIKEKTLKPDHPSVALSLNNLAVLYNAKGDYARAEPLYQRALAIREKALGPDHPEVASSLHNLAWLYDTKGDYARAEPLYQRALSIREKALGSHHPQVAMALSALAGLYHAKGDYTRAEPLYRRALAIREKALGPHHPQVASSLNNLAVLLKAKGDYARAEPLYRRALVIWENALAPDHPDVASSLHNLAKLYQAKGDYARAEPLVRRALAIREKALPPDHPHVAASLHSLADLYLARNDTRRAIQHMAQATAIENRNATRELVVGSDEQRRAYMATFRGTTYAVISLHVQAAPEAANAERLALTTILNRKGRVLDAMVDSFGALRGRLAPSDRALFDRWRALTEQYSALAVRGPGAAPIHQYRTTLKELDEQRQDAENKLSFGSTEPQVALRPVTVDQVETAIPEGAALVELAWYAPFNTKAATPKGRWGKPRYVAYVLRQGREIAWADLGEAAPIQAAVAQLLPTLHRAVAGAESAARKLDALIMQPIRHLLGDTRWVFLSPDDVLNLVPFAALVDENGHFLVERYSFSYLASGRDLLQSRFAVPSKGGAVVVGAPDFGEGPALGTDLARDPDMIGNASRHERSADMRARVFAPLLFAAEEARTIHARLGNAALLLGPNATEGAVKALHGPRLLHIATHGFFLPDQTPVEVPPVDAGGIRAEDRFSLGLRYAENALLRSGLALAGANAQKSGRDDGILTALEAAQIDLAGTKLVVMSACQTGIGKVESGDGVYGLRRALTLAGAETEVMSLWRVDDQATSKLMAAYYDGLLSGGGRSEALRQGQLAMLNNSDTAHPYFWASFIVSGNPAVLDGTLVAPDFAKVPPGPRGCACELGSGAPGPASAWWVAMAAFAIARMRRSCRGWLITQRG